MTTEPLLDQEDMASRDRSQTASGALNTVHIVMATTGEWSDRSEWPIIAYRTEAEAEANIERLTGLVVAANEMVGASPAYDAPNKSWDRFWTREKAALAALADVGVHDLDTRFFSYAVPLSSAEPADRDKSRDVKND